jgi:nucleoside-diphosphate-sugar epimerase
LSELVPRRLPPLPVPVPDLPVQFIHQDDVAEALRLCVVAAGPAGAYNIAADDVLSGVDVARAFGLRAFPLPGAPVRAAAAALAKLPFLPSRAQWVEALSHPAIMDTTRARTDLGWKPAHSALESLRETLP